MEANFKLQLSQNSRHSESGQHRTDIKMMSMPTLKAKEGPSLSFSHGNGAQLLITMALSQQVDENPLYQASALPAQTYSCFRNVPQQSPYCILAATHLQLSALTGVRPLDHSVVALPIQPRRPARAHIGWTERWANGIKCHTQMTLIKEHKLTHKFQTDLNIQFKPASSI